MAKKIRNLTILEGSLVDAGANLGAKILLYKGLARELDEIVREEPPEAQPELIRETVKYYLGEPEETETMVTKQEPNRLELDGAIAARCAALAPTLSTGEALMRFWDDPTLQALYARYLQAHPGEVAPVEKRLPGAKIWSAITKKADAERRPDETREAAIARLMTEDDPDGTLYRGYQAERDAG